MAAPTGTEADWVTVNVSPAIVSVPVRGVNPKFGETEKVTISSPLPLPLEVTTTHAGSPLEAVHPHPAGALTLMFPVPPWAPNDWPEGDIE
jgi:hypothetical protein